MAKQHVPEWAEVSAGVISALHIIVRRMSFLEIDKDEFAKWFADDAEKQRKEGLDLAARILESLVEVCRGENDPKPPNLTIIEGGKGD